MPASRIIRLLRLVQELQCAPNQTPDALRRRLGVSRSTLFSDLKVLSDAGLAWNYDRSTRRYRSASDGPAPLQHLSLEEVLALVLAVEHFTESGDRAMVADAVEAIRKLVAATPSRTRRMLERALESLVRHRFRVDLTTLGEVLDARRSGRRLMLDYQNRSTAACETLDVAPYQIFFRGRAIYVDAYVVNRMVGGRWHPDGQLVVLRASRIVRVHGTSGLFEVPDTYDFAERHRHTFRAIRADGRPIRVRVRFAAKVADLIREAHWHESQRIDTCSDGAVILTLEVSEPLEVLWYLVMPYAEHADVLEPPSLRAEMVRIATLVVHRMTSA
jgi:predicted DNA-binding transcriptional regulator YafY